jgi:hypothetical protein
MPQNGEINQKFGFFKNQCCGKEIALPKGNEFPSCPNHPGLITNWVPVVDDKYRSPYQQTKVPAAPAEVQSG